MGKSILFGCIGAVAVLVGVLCLLNRSPANETAAVAAQKEIAVAESRTNSDKSLDRQPAQDSLAKKTFVADSVPRLPPNAVLVPDKDLVTLSDAVDLSNAEDHQPDKTNWKEAIVVAQRLLQGPCDCEQRNWLTHFVEMGNFALTDAEKDYRESARLMATLGRNDQQAMAMSQRVN